MKVKMLKNTKGSIDGFTVKMYIEGNEYIIPESLGDVFVDLMKVAIVPVINDNEPANEIMNKTIKVPMPINIESLKKIKLEIPEAPEELIKIKKQVPKKKQPRKRKVKK